MPKFDRNNPAYATVINRFPLTKEGSTKQTWHITLHLEGGDLDYLPGDSIGVCPQNDPILVEHLISAMKARPEDTIIHKRSGKSMSLETFLTFYANLARITSSFLKLIHECEERKEKREEIACLLSDKDCLRAFLAEKDPLMLLRDFATSNIPLQELCDQFGPLLPRFYSIASSKYLNEDTLDLTVALFTWMQGEEKRYGVASHFLCHLAELNNTPVPIFVQPAHHFRLPDNHDTDIIMVGPGTGIAPFRAFMQERAFHGASGKHLLFFGERNSKSDFFYEEEWKNHKNLQVFTAFSRDQAEKVYVQHKLMENSTEIYSCLENGAYLYVCGDAKEMAKDVEKILLEIIQKQGGHSPEEAKSYLHALRKQGHFLLDIY